MKVGGLFSGIGGFELGLVRAGFEIAWMVEIDDFCQKVLRKHAPAYWPNAEIFGDIHNVGKYNLKPVDLICGGFPCQPFSNAGKQLGETDDRHLWPEMLRIVQELKPRWVIGENVTGFAGLYLDQSIIDLEGQGYETWSVEIPACAVNAPHRRSRIFILAYSSIERCGTRRPKSKRQQGEPRINGNGSPLAYSNDQWQQQPQRGISQERGRTSDGGQNVAYPNPSRWDGRAGELWQARGEQLANGNWWSVEPGLGRVANGIPNRLDRVRSIGNAVVPQIPEILGRMIQEIERATIAQEAD